jgi:hypothetical protein
VLNEGIEAGTIIDTHPPSLTADNEGDDERAQGFVQIFDEELVVQLYKARSIGLLPFATDDRVITVSRWRPLWASPAVQLIVSLGVVTITLLSFSFAFIQARDKLPPLLGNAAASPRAAETIAAGATAVPAAAAPATAAQDSTKTDDQHEPR